MTKSKSTKLTALLLAGVLATSCFVGGTLARYVTSTSSEDSARVAVWGINADEVTMDLFDATYTVNGVTVAQSEDGDNIIAPGTEKDNYFSIVNLDDNLKPEVMYEIAINLDDSEIDPLILNNPSIVWRLDEGTYGTWEETKAQVLALSGDASGVKTYAPLEIAENFKAGKTHKIGWKWIMDNNNNVMDTEMGNKAATDGDISAKISIKVTATQVNVDTTGMLNGNGQVYDVNNPTPLVFRSAAPVDELQSVKVGNTTLTQGTEYTVSSGSTVITLKESYLSSLAVGNYTISIISNSMTARATFAVAEIEDTTSSNDSLVHNGIIPEGGVYYSNVSKSLDPWGWGLEDYWLSAYSGAEKTYVAGEAFPEPKLGDVYVYEDYEYKYGYNINLNNNWSSSNKDGWGVAVLDNSKNTYSSILNTINGKNIVTLDYMFYNNKSITTAPVIPDTVTSLQCAFEECDNLTTAPVIPSKVTNLTFTFSGCDNLTGTIEINTNPTEYMFALSRTQITEITGTISDDLKTAVLATKSDM